MPSQKLDDGRVADAPRDNWLDRYAPRITTVAPPSIYLRHDWAGILAEVVSKFAGHWQVRNR